MSPKKATAKKIPVIKNIHQTLYKAVSQPDALNMATWHSCETTHCRAGWVVTLAGKEGKELEKKTTTLFAAMQIYKASGYEISPVRFYDDNKKAMEDMKRLAEEEAKR
jgi:lysine/ornithine N-monooxygenase